MGSLPNVSAAHRRSVEHLGIEALEVVKKPSSGAVERSPVSAVGDPFVLAFGKDAVVHPATSPFAAVLHSR
jgi:hypothetical protein